MPEYFQTERRAVFFFFSLVSFFHYPLVILRNWGGEMTSPFTRFVKQWNNSNTRKEFYFIFFFFFFGLLGCFIYSEGFFEKAKKKRKIPYILMAKSFL